MQIRAAIGTHTHACHLLLCNVFDDVVFVSSRQTARLRLCFGFNNPSNDWCTAHSSSTHASPVYFWPKRLKIVSPKVVTIIDYRIFVRRASPYSSIETIFLLLTCGCHVTSVVQIHFQWHSRSGLFTSIHIKRAVTRPKCGLMNRKIFNWDMATVPVNHMLRRDVCTTAISAKRILRSKLNSIFSI